MLVLLPPSEGKAPAPRRGRAVDLGRLSFPELAAHRRELADRLVDLSAASDALERLGLGPSLAAELAANQRIWTAPSRPAGDLYTGVLYDALRLPDLPAAARRRANREVVVVSGLWGALRPADRIPAYRLPIGADVPALAGLAAWWRPRLEAALDAAAGRAVIVDCRSTGYAAMWTPRGVQARRWVAVRVLRETARGGPASRSVVSHLAKLTRGQLTRELLLSSARPRTPQQVAEVAASAFEIELTEPERPGRPWVLDVVLRED